jgi:predicted flap endonuclease-1-like 5' DNA nuclease
MAKLIDIEGIGPKYAEKLQRAGVQSVGALLKSGSTPQGRKKLAETANISGDLILEWVNHADLFRIKGVGEEYSDLLEEAGVDTVPELATRNAKNLFEKLEAVNKEKDLVRRLPVLAQVEDWIKQAKELPRIIQY